MESILTSIKKLAGLTEEYEYFDIDIIMYINSVLLDLKQMGVGPAEGYVVTDESNAWVDFIPDKELLREAVKTFVAAKVRMKFDPPSGSSHLEALRETIREAEWRLCLEAESSK